MLNIHIPKDLVPDVSTVSGMFGRSRRTFVDTFAFWADSLRSIFSSSSSTFILQILIKIGKHRDSSVVK